MIFSLREKEKGVDGVGFPGKFLFKKHTEPCFPEPKMVELLVFSQTWFFLSQCCRRSYSCCISQSVFAQNVVERMCLLEQLLCYS